MVFKIPDESEALNVPLFERPARRVARPPRKARVRLDSGEIVEGLELTPPDETEEEHAKRVQEWESTAKDIRLRLRQVTSDEIDAEEARVRAETQAEIVRLAKLRKATPRDENPLVHVEQYETPESLEAHTKLAHAWLERTLVGIDGIQVGQQSSTNITDPKRLIGILARLRWDHHAAAKARSAQRLVGIDRLD